MPTGKVINPKDPNSAQAYMGQVQQVDGTVYSFLNSANLKKNDPVLFGIIPSPVTVYGLNYNMSVAVLEGTADGEIEIAKNNWTQAFKAKWDTEWRKEDPDAIVHLNIKGRNATLGELLNYTSIDDINNPTPSKI